MAKTAMKGMLYSVVAIMTLCHQTLLAFQGLPCAFTSNGTVANCSYRMLTHFPSNVPDNITGLNLTHNKMSLLNISQRLNYLVYLDVSYNELNELHINTFKHVPNLEKLFLNNNNLQLEKYPDDVFKPLQRLFKLHIQNNKISDTGVYPDRALGQLGKLKELSIDTYTESNFSSGFGKMKRLKRLLLGFHGCHLTVLRNETFKIFSKVDIEVLNMNHCPIVEVEKNAFFYLKSLRYLFMSYTNQNPKTAVTSMYGLQGRNMSEIQLDELMPLYVLKTSNLDSFILSSDLTQIFKEVCVAKLSMKHNQIIWVAIDKLYDSRFASCIQHFDVSLNDLYGDGKLLFMMAFFSKLKYFDMARYSSKSKCLQVTKKPTNPDGRQHLGFTLTPELQYLDVTGFAVNCNDMRNLYFYNATSLKELRFAYNKIMSFGKMTGLQNLSSLDLSGNTCGNLTPTFFDSFSGLFKLNMSDAGLNKPEDYLSDTGPRLLKPLKNLNTLIISHNDLTFLYRNLLIANPIRHIDLSYNRFENIPFDLTTTESLQYLDLSFNSVTVLEQYEMDLLDMLALDHNITLDMTGNLLFCGCDNLKLISWLYNTEVTIINAQDYSCIGEDGSINNAYVTYQNIDMLWRKCSGKFWLSVSITCFSVIILAMGFLYVLCWRKTLVLNILLRLFGFNTLIKQPSCKDFRFDSFLGYSEHDCQYICDTVAEHLENKHNIRAYITDRDMLPGRSIPQEIVAAVDASWKVVLFVTRAFLEDNWCRFIADYAVYVSTTRPSGCVLLVLFDDVRRGDLPPAVLNVVEERHIFRVMKYNKDEDMLWKDIRDAIEPE